MRTRILLVRHGDSAHKRDGIIGGPRGCQGLTEIGHQQAGRLAERIGSGIAAVYSSILPRAVQTAEPLAAQAGLPVVQDCRLCSWHAPSDVDGQRWVDYQRDHAVQGGGVFRPFERGNESWAELVLRTSQSILEIAERHRGQTTVIVGHGETVNAAFSTFGQLPLFRPFDTEVSPASITEWVTEEDPTGWPPSRWTLMRFNEVAA